MKTSHYDKDEEILEEKYFIYSLIDNLAIPLEMPEKVFSNDLYTSFICDISNEGLVAIGKDKVYIVKIKWR